MSLVYGSVHILLRLVSTITMSGYASDKSFHRKQTDILQVRSITYTPLVMLTRLYQINTIQMGNGHKLSHWHIESPIIRCLFVIRLYKICLIHVSLSLTINDIRISYLCRCFKYATRMFYLLEI